MIDRVEEYHPEGGPHGLGFDPGDEAGRPVGVVLRGPFPSRIRSARGRWVWNPSSNSLKWWQRGGGGSAPRPGSSRSGLGDLHRWTYRGQILPTDGLVTVRAVVTEVDDARRWIKADGFLDVDGRVIYQMNDFTLRLDG